MSCKTWHLNDYTRLQCRPESRRRKVAFYLIKVSNDLIQESEALHSHVVPVQLDVEIVEVRDGGKQDAYLCVGLIVQILIGKRKYSDINKVRWCFLMFVMFLFSAFLSTCLSVCLPACLLARLTMFLGLDIRKCWATCAGRRLKRILLLSSLTFSMPSLSSSAWKHIPHTHTHKYKYTDTAMRTVACSTFSPHGVSKKPHEPYMVCVIAGFSTKHYTTNAAG